ncbi:zinc finger, CCHC-type containing protein, partial [Tanacetum coccineum]
DEFHKLVGDLATIDIAISHKDHALLLLTSLPSSYRNFVETLFYDRETLKLEYVLATLNSRELQKIIEAKGDGGALKRDCPMYIQKKSQDFIKRKDQVSDSGGDGYNICDVMMVMSVEQLLNWIMDSEGSYHMTYKRDYLFDFEEYDGVSSVQDLWAEDTTMCMYLVNRSPSPAIAFMDEEEENKEQPRDENPPSILAVENATYSSIQRDPGVRQPIWNYPCAPYFEGRSVRNQDNVTNEHHYHFDIYNETIDFQLRELNSRFSEKIVELLELSSTLDPRDGYLKHFELDLKDHLVLGKSSSIDDLCQGLAYTGKASHYYLVDRMGDDFLLDNLVLYIEKDIEETFCLDSVIDDFSAKQRRVRLEEYMDTRSNVSVLSNGCKEAATTTTSITRSIHQVTKGLLDKAKGNVLGMEIFKDQNRNTLRVSQSRFYNGKLVQTLLEGHSILSLEGNLLGECDVEKNSKWSYTYAVESHVYQGVCTRPDIALAGVGMLDGFDRGLQTCVQVFVDFDYVIEGYFTEGTHPEFETELNTVAVIATRALEKVIPGPRFQHG